MGNQQATSDKVLELSKSYLLGKIMTLDNPTHKKTLGEIAVCKNLTQLGYKVFVEFGNFLKVDLIAMNENFELFKIQVKAVESKMQWFQFIRLNLV